MHLLVIFLMAACSFFLGACGKKSGSESSAKKDISGTYYSDYGTAGFGGTITLYPGGSFKIEDPDFGSDWISGNYYVEGNTVTLRTKNADVVRLDMSDERLITTDRGTIITSVLGKNQIFSTRRGTVYEKNKASIEPESKPTSTPTLEEQEKKYAKALADTPKLIVGGKAWWFPCPYADIDLNATYIRNTDLYNGPYKTYNPGTETFFPDGSWTANFDRGVQGYSTRRGTWEIKDGEFIETDTTEQPIKRTRYQILIMTNEIFAMRYLDGEFKDKVWWAMRWGT